MKLTLNEVCYDSQKTKKYPERHIKRIKKGRATL